MPQEGRERLDKTCSEWLASGVYVASRGGEGRELKIILQLRVGKWAQIEKWRGISWAVGISFC